SDAERILGDGTPADFIADALISIAPSRLSANGLNTASARVEMRPTESGLPIGAQLAFSLSRHGGELIEGAENGEARFVANRSDMTVRLVDPSDPAIRVFFNGKVVLTETFIAPLLEPSSVNAETRLDLTTSILGRESEAQTNPLPLDRSMAPLLSEVRFNGQNDFSGVMGGLEATSTAARLVWGDLLEIVGQNFATVASGNNVTIGGVQASDVSVNSAGTQIICTIPEGASTGPVSVIVGGFGGKTNQNLVIAGAAFEEVAIAPNGSNIAVNGEFTITMSREVDPQTLNAVRLVDSDGDSLGWAQSLADDGRTIRLYDSESTSMQDGQTYRIQISSELAALDASPTLHYDPIRNLQATGTPEVKTIATFTAMAPDNTQPSLVSSNPSNAQEIDVRAPLTFTFSEAINPASVADAHQAGALEIFNITDSADVSFTWSLNASMTILTLTPNQALAGNSSFNVTLPATSNALTDLSGNSLDPFIAGGPSDLQIGFSTSLGILDISPRSGPVGTTVTVSGGRFTGTPTATVGGLGAAVNVVDQNTLEITVPNGAEGYRGGPVIVSVGDESASAPSDFTVTLQL
ncbi:MAG: Ig-like domain-containing protein, partial [Planctomycetes bacterium]|nr:Ig-like domain-containing protein [Planctomycetota bacterium]